VNKGDILGVIGRNGAGKSTLLKILAGVTPPTGGRVTVQGHIFPMIELNAGLHMELTGRENVRLLGAIAGLDRRQVNSKMAAIKDFCELGDWFEKPARTYSSGMLARLGFGVAMNVDATILLIDEVLAVGDLAFQRKCFERIEQLRVEGTTILLVSHNLRQIQRICDRVVWLDSGKQINHGETESVTLEYYEKSSEWNLNAVRKGQSYVNRGNIIGTGEAVVKSVTILSGSDVPCEKFKTGEPIDFEIVLENKKPFGELFVGLAVFTPDFIRVCNFVYRLTANQCVTSDAIILRCSLPELPLLPGVYLISVAIKKADNRLLFRGEHLAEFLVASSDATGNQEGLVYVNPEWKCITTRL